MRTKHFLSIAALVGAASLLVGCASGDADAETSPALTIAPEPSASAPADDASAETPGEATASLPAPIVAVDYELDDTPGNDDDDIERTTTDPAHLSALTALLESHGVLSDYERDDDCDNDEWELDLDVLLEGGSVIDIEIETCSPNDFETELIELVGSWG